VEQAIPPDLGPRLRQARLRQGSTLAHVGATLGVAPRSLRALEWGRLDLLPDESTAQTIARAYAEHLALEPLPIANGGAPAVLATLAAEPDEKPPRQKRRLVDRDLAPFLVVFTPALTAVALIILFDSLDGSGSKAQASASARVQVSPPPPPAAPSATVGLKGVAVASARGSERRPAPSPAARPDPPARTAMAKLAVTASRGDSWVVVRAGSAAGEILFGGILKQDRSLDFARPRLWLRLGAASNVDLRVNGARPALDLYGTVDVVIGPNGARKVPPAP
jgi:hypothetical protein